MRQSYKTSLIIFYYISILLLFLLSLSFPIIKLNKTTLELVTITEKYHFSLEKVNIINAFEIDNEIFVVGIDDSNGEMKFFKLHPKGNIEKIMTYTPYYTRFIDVKYSRRKKAFLITSYSDHYKQRALEAVSLSGELLWIYGFYGGPYSVNFPNPDYNYIVLNVNRNEKTSTAVMLDLNGNKLEEYEVRFPNFQIIAANEKEYYLSVYLKQSDRNLIVKTLPNFDVQWTQLMPKKFETVSSFYNDKIYLSKNYMGKKGVTILDSETGDVKENISINKLPDPLAKITAPLCDRKGNLYFLYHGYNHLDNIQTGFLKINTNRNQKLIMLDYDKAVPISIVNFNEEIVLISSVINEEGKCQDLLVFQSKSEE